MNKYKYTYSYYRAGHYEKYIFEYNKPSEFKKLDFVADSGTEEYYLNNSRHRLDGPAVIYNSPLGKNHNTYMWYIHGSWLYDFDIFFNESIDFDKILRYIKNQPRYTNFVIMLCRENQWISEEQILLLILSDLFK